MKIKRYRLKEIIQEELSETHSHGEGLREEEVPIASVIYMLMGKALDYIHEYRGDMSDDEDVSKDFENFHKKLAAYWKILDDHEDLAGGETPQDLMRPIQESIKENNKNE